MNTLAAPSLRHRLASNQWLRRAALPILRRLDLPITMQNPYVKRPIKLLSFTHKGYWFYGKHRESATMARFAALILPGDTVLEVGGHIGVITQVFSEHVGASGQVHVFEPGLQNTRFLTKNIATLANTTHVFAAVSDHNGTATLYEENLGGFMNSLDPNFATASDLARNQRRKLDLHPRAVQTVTLDRYCNDHALRPDFIKIDVEGLEKEVLEGAKTVLKHARAIMVEIARNQYDIWNLLGDAGFDLTDEQGHKLSSASQMHGNVFGIKNAMIQEGNQ